MAAATHAVWSIFNAVLSALHSLPAVPPVSS